MECVLMLTGGVYVDELTEHIIKHPSEIPGLLQKGNSLRETASTDMNKTSSRSHAVFAIIVEHSVIEIEGATTGCAHASRHTATGQPPTVTIGRLNMVDLAGSERSKTTGITGGKRLEELKKINTSLTAFGRCNGSCQQRVMLRRQSDSGADVARQPACPVPRLEADAHPARLAGRQLQDHHDHRRVALQQRNYALCPTNP